MSRAPTETPTPHPDPSATTRDESALAHHKQLFLLVVGDGVLATEPLPSSGVATIGRAQDNDVRIDDESISRDHAVIHLDEPLRIEDLGSANGTWVRDERIAPKTPTAIQLDQAIRMGSITVIVQRRMRALRMRRRRTYQYFENRLEEECARAIRRPTSFVVVHMVVTEPTMDIETALFGVLREGDIVAEYAPRELVLLLLDVEPSHAGRILDRIRTALAEVVERVDLGAAWFPQDSREPNGLTARARAAAHGVPTDPGAPADLIIADPRMSELHTLVRRVAAAEISVLLHGETGVGKEVIAEQIHRLSARADKPFLRLNCAALSESLLESELFGHERGAFTGAIATKQGLLEVASGGIVFLDEVGELHPSTQAKLLRVLDERKLMRVGGVTLRPIDVRIISATNRDLDAEVERGNFRLDLLYRLNAMSIIIPPLRERPGEIEPLARKFLAKTAEKYRRPVPRLTPAAVAALREYSWPGNVRELRNVIERALVLAPHDVVDVDDLPIEKMRSVVAVPALTPPLGMPVQAAEGELDEEHQRVLAALEECGGNQTHAARLLGISRRTLINKLEKFAVRRPRKR